MLCRASRPLPAPSPPGKAPLVPEPFPPAISRGLCAAGLPTPKVEPGSSAGEIESGQQQQEQKQQKPKGGSVASWGFLTPPWPAPTR